MNTYNFISILCSYNVEFCLYNNICAGHYSVIITNIQKLNLSFKQFFFDLLTKSGSVSITNILCIVISIFVGVIKYMLWQQKQHYFVNITEYFFHCS